MVGEEWYHMALVRSGSTLTAYFDGNSIGSTTFTGTIGNVGGNCYIGYWPQFNDVFGGYQDEIRWSNIARYTANFTPSTSALPNDVNTLLLLHVDTDYADDAAGNVTNSEWTYLMTL
jgi:hypothetical protein